jgi:hypothetical protein
VSALPLQVGIIELLESMAPVTALVGTRIFSNRLPMSGVLPAIRVQVIDGYQDAHLRGVNALCKSRVQIDCVSGEAFTSDPDGEADALAEAVHGPGDGTGLAGFQGVTPGSPSLAITAILPLNKRVNYYADEVRQVIVMRDYYVWWRTT